MVLKSNQKYGQNVWMSGTGQKASNIVITKCVLALQRHIFSYTPMPSFSTFVSRFLDWDGFKTIWCSQVSGTFILQMLSGANKLLIACFRVASLTNGFATFRYILSKVGSRKIIGLICISMSTLLIWAQSDIGPSAHLWGYH
jgi:hypothetical protein